MTDTAKDGRKTSGETVNEGARMAAENSARAAGEMMRAAADASRRTVEGARATANVTREYMDQTADAGRKLFDAWASGAEASLQAAFALQNTALSAGLSLVEANNASGCAAAQRWSDAARQAQQATLEAWRASVSAAQKLAATGDKTTQQ